MRVVALDVQVLVTNHKRSRNVFTRRKGVMRLCCDIVTDGHVKYADK